MALVQMSTSFNAAKLQTVITKLSTIKSGIEANQAKDVETHAQSETRYNNLLQEVAELRASKNASLAQTRG